MAEEEDGETSEVVEVAEVVVTSEVEEVAVTPEEASEDVAGEAETSVEGEVVASVEIEVEVVSVEAGEGIIVLVVVVDLVRKRPSTENRTNSLILNLDICSHHLDAGIFTMPYSPLSCG